MKVLWNISGGAIKFVALIACVIRMIERKKTPDAISGVSAGAIIALGYLTHTLPQMFELAKRSHNRRMIFSRGCDPVGKIGGLSLGATWRILTGKNYLGIMDNFEYALRHIVTEVKWHKRKHIPCYIMMVSEQDGRHILVDISKEKYEDAIDAVIASCTIAPTIKARNFKGEPCMDGGHRAHSAGAWLLRNNTDQLTGTLEEVVSIYSRPELSHYDISDLKPRKSFFSRLLNIVIAVFIREISMNDELLEDRICFMNSIDYYPIHIPRFVEDTYDITRDQIEIGISLGTKAADEYVSNHKFGG